MTKMQKSVLSAGVFLLLICGFWQLNKIEVYSSHHFLDDTVINGVDCSGMTVKEAETVLTDKWNKHSFEVRKDGKLIGKIENLDFTYDIEEQLSHVMDRPIYEDLWRYVTKNRKTASIDMRAKELTEHFQQQIGNLKFLNRSYKVKTKDAYVDLSNRKFKIIKEVYGDNTDKDRFCKKVLKLIGGGTFSLEYREEDYYQLPRIRSTDQKLLDYRELCKKNLSQKITYRFHNGDYTVTPAELKPMIDSRDGNRLIVKKAVRKFVKRLAASRNTLGSSRLFRSTYRGTINVSGGSYGYLIDKKREYDALLKNLKSGKDVARKPKYSQIPFFSGNGSNDIGLSYVEIDIANQHLWLYRDGNVIAETPVVTGSLEGGFATPKGVYYLVYKIQDVKLKGRNSDGSRYESPVKYWMPFYQDYGMHDAAWRSDFGGSIYRSGGSHGCVNMPRSTAAVVYANITAGYPVIVH